MERPWIQTGSLFSAPWGYVNYDASYFVTTPWPGIVTGYFSQINVRWGSCRCVHCVIGCLCIKLCIVTPQYSHKYVRVNFSEEKKKSNVPLCLFLTYLRKEGCCKQGLSSSSSYLQTGLKTCAHLCSSSTCMRPKHIL